MLTVLLAALAAAVAAARPGMGAGRVARLAGGERVGTKGVGAGRVSPLAGGERVGASAHRSAVLGGWTGSRGSSTGAGNAAAPRRPGPVARSPVLASCLAGVAVAVLVGLPIGLLPGVVVAVSGPQLLARLETGSARDRRRRREADLPLALDLLAACLAGGAAPADAVAVIAGAVGGPCGERFASVAAALAVGTPAAEAWRLLAGEPEDGRSGGVQSPDALAAAARALARAAEGGAPVAGTVAGLAADARLRAAAQAEQAARRVGVLVVAPLGLCFLPAFVLLGVVPVVAGLAGPLLATW